VDAKPSQPPVMLHEILHALNTGFGTKPRPLPSGDLQTIPVRVALFRPGDHFPFAVVDATAWEMLPYRPPVRDAKTGKEVAPERLGEFFIYATVPEEPTRDREPQPHAGDHPPTG
jgi:hypothetical protein